MLEEVRLSWCPHLLEVEAFLLKIRKTRVDGQVRNLEGARGGRKLSLLYIVHLLDPCAVAGIPIKRAGNTPRPMYLVEHVAPCVA